MNIDSLNEGKGDLSGFISIDFLNETSFSECCAKNIPGYEAERFEPVAIRFYLGKEMSITLYAKDRGRNDESTSSPEKFPVKKFKLSPMFFQQLQSYIRQCNFTLSTGAYPVDEMEVMNK
jgi:hypothetical protein